MKKTIVLILILISLKSFSQRIGVGIGAGVISAAKTAAVGEFAIAYKLTDNVILYPVTFKINSMIRDARMPPIVESRIGLRSGVVEFYGGIGWRGYNPDNEPKNEGYGGFRPAAGIILHPYRSVTVSSGITGFDKNKMISVTVGALIFK